MAEDTSGNGGNASTAAAIAAIGDVTNTALNWYIQSDLNKDNRKFAKDMAKWQNERQIEMWNMQNAYNDPSAQMQRLKNAGLNPALMYGSGASAGNASSMPTVETPSYQGHMPELNFVNAAGLISQYQDFQMRNLEMDRIKKATQLLDEQIDGIFWDNIRKNFDFGLDYGEPFTVNMVNHNGKTFSYQNPNWKSADGGTYGPKKFYDMNAIEASNALKWKDVDIAEQHRKIAIRDYQQYDTKDRILKAQAAIQEATQAWLERRMSDWNTYGAYADKLQPMSWFEMAHTSDGKYTLGQLQLYLNALKAGTGIVGNVATGAKGLGQ